MPIVIVRVHYVVTNDEINNHYRIRTRTFLVVWVLHRLWNKQVRRESRVSAVVRRLYDISLSHTTFHMSFLDTDYCYDPEQ